MDHDESPDSSIDEVLGENLRNVSRFLSRLSLPISIFCLPFTQAAQALRNPDMSGNDAGAVAVYTFDENSGDTAFDSSGVGTPLNLKMSTAGNLPTNDGTTIRTNALLGGGRLLINAKPNGSESGMPDQGYQSAQRHRTFLVSEAQATKLSQCTSGFTIHAFVRSWFPFHGSNSGNMIVGLSNSESQATIATPNFGLFQSGMVGSEAALLRVKISTGVANQASVSGAFSSVREFDNPEKITELIATMESNGIMTVYVNRIARSSLTGITPAFSAGAKLVIGNELVPLTTAIDRGNTITVVEQQRNWSGEIHHLAIYCRGFSRAEIQGDLALSKARAEVVRPNDQVMITPGLQAARRFVERLSGGVVPIQHPMVARVEEALKAGDRIAAARIVTGDAATNEPGHPDFLNVVVKQMALKMSNRDETIRAPLNDFAAAFIGVTRDEISAKELLTGDFYYMADPAKAKVRSDIFRDLLISNNHYEDLESGQWDIGKVLMKVSGQKIAMDPNGSMTENPDPAGVLTSRAFMSAHAIAGTNRRMVEYTFRSFMCVPMAEMADTSASPARIGRDIDRMPGGDGTKFEMNCKGCHTVMDGFRGAFGRFDFASITVNNQPIGFIRNTQVSGTGTFGFKPDGNNRTIDNGIVYKMNHNNSVFPNGYEITDDSFVNNAVGTNNRALFGWRGSNARGGFGVNQFGRMVSDSQRFSQCMAKRAYESICTTGAASETRVSPVIAELAVKFEKSGYKLRALFQEVAANSACGINQVP